MKALKWQLMQSNFCENFGKWRPYLELFGVTGGQEISLGAAPPGPPPLGTALAEISLSKECYTLTENLEFFVKRHLEGWTRRNFDQLTISVCLQHSGSCRPHSSLVRGKAA